MFKKEHEPVANCDHLENINIEAMIHVIRGVQVMLDSDLALLYGVENKRLNEQVKRNIIRFPPDFMFQLSKEEYQSLRPQNTTLKLSSDNLKSQIATSSWGGTRKCPYAFTRNGVAMLSSVLRSETAVGVNIEHHQQETDEKIDLILDRIDEISPKQLPEAIFPTGCVWDANIHPASTSPSRPFLDYR